MIEELAQYDATALGELVRKGEITPTELLERALGRLERVNARLNAVVHTTYDHARIAIRHGPSHGPFASVPFLLKDLIVELEGSPFAEGSKAVHGYRSKVDSELQ